MSSDFTARSRQYQDALYEALAGAESGISDAEPLNQLADLVQRCRFLTAEHTIANQALEALAAVARRPNVEAAMSDVATRFESPQRFRESLYFVRCMERDAEAALALLDARNYVETAIAPVSVDADLATDQAALLDGNTFARLWQEPQRRDWLLDTVDIWKRRYFPVYLEHHTAYNSELAEVARQIDALQTQATAVERLNGLPRLGAPQAQAALDQFHELERLFPCPAGSESLSAILQDQPICPYCGYSLGQEAPSADARRVQHAIERGLASQQARLAQRVVSRLLARPERAGNDRLDKFIEVVQAADLTGLAAVLDDGLIAFLQDLLDSPTPSTILLDQLALTFPEIRGDNVESAVGEFRRLLHEELERNGGRLRLRYQEPDA